MPTRRLVTIRFNCGRINYAHRDPAVTTPLTDRERQVLEAVIETYVQTAEPAGSRTIAKRHQLGLSPATIRNTMSDLEEKGYLYHPQDRKSTRLNSSHGYISYAVFCLKKKKNN